MATHSSILAWRISWTEEPGGLQPIVSQRIRHDRAHMHGGLPSRDGMRYAWLLAQSCPALCEPLNCSYQAPLSMGVSK